MTFSGFALAHLVVPYEDLIMSTEYLGSGRERDGTTTDAENADGVDVSLVRWMLSLTPDERLDVLQTFVDGVVGAWNGRTQQ
jgi:hypothetical protein